MDPSSTNRGVLTVLFLAAFRLSRSSLDLISLLYAVLPMPPRHLNIPMELFNSMMTHGGTEASVFL